MTGSPISPIYRELVGFNYEKGKAAETGPGWGFQVSKAEAVSSLEP